MAQAGMERAFGPEAGRHRRRHFRGVKHDGRWRRKPSGTVPFFGVRAENGDCPPLRRRFSERAGRKWIAVDSELDYVIGSAFRLMQDCPGDDVAEFIARSRNQENGAVSLERQKALF
jgi:hypothetical protein